MLLIIKSNKYNENDKEISTMIPNQDKWKEIKTTIKKTEITATEKKMSLKKNFNK
jgi:hypothetical protein